MSVVILSGVVVVYGIPHKYTSQHGHGNLWRKAIIRVGILELNSFVPSFNEMQYLYV